MASRADPWARRASASLIASTRMSLLTAVTVLVISAVAVFGFVVTRQSVERQNQALLDKGAGQAALFASTSLAAVGTLLGNLANITSYSGGSPSAFEKAASPVAIGGLAFALVANKAGRWTVEAAVGNAFSSGEALSGPVASTIGQAGSTFIAAPVVYAHGLSTAGFAVGAPSTPAGLAIYAQYSVNPLTITPVTDAKPFESLKVALYGSKTPAPGALFVATTRELPLTGAHAQVPVSVGGSTWTLVAVPRNGALAGRFANDGPWLILSLGLLLAVVIGFAVEFQGRRRAFAERLVAARTSELLASQEALVRAERLSVVGEMTTIIGHELRNPLAAVTNSHYLLRCALEDGDQAEAQHRLTLAERETARAANLAEDLTAYMRQRVPEPAPLGLRQVVDEVLEISPVPKGIEVLEEVEPLVIEADDRQVHQLLVNLVNNACQAMPEGGTLHIAAHGEGDCAVIAVEDSGMGFDEETKTRLFDPFFTTKVGGTGLGLAIVQRIAVAHGGEVSIENRPTHGASVTVRLPMHAKSEEVQR